MERPSGGKNLYCRDLRFRREDVAETWAEVCRLYDVLNVESLKGQSAGAGYLRRYLGECKGVFVAA